MAGATASTLVEDVIDPVRLVAYPRCVAGARACPPDDCGGPGGYADLVGALADPEHEEHEALTIWVGGTFDASAFDVKAADAALARYRKEARKARPAPERQTRAKSTAPDLQARLSGKERDDLERILEARRQGVPVASSLTTVHGFLTSVVSGPMVLPSEWLAVVCGDGAWDSMDQARLANTLLLRFHNEIAGESAVRASHLQDPH